VRSLTFTHIFLMSSMQMIKRAPSGKTGLARVVVTERIAATHNFFTAMNLWWFALGSAQSGQA
jgi:hypothetical protein